MTLKKLTVIAVAAGVMISCAVYVGLRLEQKNEVQYEIGQEEYTINGTTKTFGETEPNLPMLDEESNKLLLPLRWVIEELKGSVAWDKEEQATVIQYQGKNLRMEADKQEAAINGYSIVLADPPVLKNGCLYVTADFMADNFDTSITWDSQQKQITLRTEAVQRPIVYKNKLSYEGKDRFYTVEVPVMVGLNDGNYEKNLNYTISSGIAEEIQGFMKATAKEGGRLELVCQVPYRSKEMISIAFSGEQIEQGKTESIYATVNIDLQTQSFLQLGELFQKDGYLQKLEKLLDGKELPEDVEEQFYFDKDRGLVLYWQNQEGVREEHSIAFVELKKLLKSKYQFLLGQNQP